MNDRVLVCYGTRYGSAGEIADKIGEILSNRGATTDVVNLKKGKVKDLDAYDLIIVGSGIQMGRWTKEPLKFLKKNLCSQTFPAHEFFYCILRQLFGFNFLIGQVHSKKPTRGTIQPFHLSRINAIIIRTLLKGMDRSLVFPRGVSLIAFSKKLSCS